MTDSGKAVAKQRNVFMKRCAFFGPKKYRAMLCIAWENPEHLELMKSPCAACAEKRLSPLGLVLYHVPRHR